jgi:signal transduction histidine kinase
MRTSAIRLALRYALLQVLVLAVALASLFWVVNRYVDEQITVSLATEVAALKSLPTAMRMNRVEALAATHSQARGARHYLLLDSQGRRLAGGIKAWPGWLKPDGIVSEGIISVPEPGDTHDDHEVRTLPAIGVTLADGSRLLIAQDPGAAEDLREVALIAAVAVLALTASLAIVLGLALGWQWLRRISAIDRTASRIAAGDLSQRVEAGGRGDEFDLLAGHLNSMLERIEQAVAGMREVSDNVAHDLRRPLARLKTRIDVLLTQPRTADDYRTALAQTAQDADELMQTFDALLSIARLEAGSEIATPERFDLAASVRTVAELYADEAEEAARPFTMDLPDTLMVRGQPALFSQALANLLDNAFNYTAADSGITVRLVSTAHQAVLEVIDHGPGLVADARARMTERFARGDAARSTPGSGLGLALVKAILHAHGGELELDDTPGGGLTVRLRLPIAPPA